MSSATPPTAPVLNEQFRAVLENMSEGLMLFNATGDLIYQNSASLRIHGFDPAESGRLGHEQVPATWKAWDDQGRAITFEEWPVSRVFRLERFQDQVLRVLRVETGHEFYGSYNGSPILGTDGKLQLGFITIRDITAEVRAREQLHRSERRLRVFFEADMIGAIYWTVDGRITDANDRFLRMMGYTREDLRAGRLNWAEMSPPEYRPLDEHALHELVTTGVDTAYEKEYIHKQGHRVAILIGAAMIDANEGVAFVLDISDRKRAEAALRTSEAHFRQLAESVPQLIWTAQPDGTVDYYNSRIHQLAGAERREDGSWHWQPLLHPDDVEPTTRAWSDAIATGTGYEMEHRVQAVDGRYHWYLSRAFPARDDQGRIVRWFGSATDIDEQKRAQEILERTVAERTARLRDTVAELEHFSYTITHDMRAPLRAMHTFAEILVEEYRPKLDATGADYLRRISSAAIRMDNLITDALSYAKAVQVELRLERVEPSPFLRGVVDSYPQFQPPHAAIVVAENLPAILANPAGFTQCVSNLLGNAVKFVVPGRQPEVNVTAEVRGSVVRLWFADNGIGIPEDQQQRIFGMFERLSSRYEGTGVGLALVRKVAEKMRGKVGVESEPGRGSRFWLEFQRAE